jgi:hypothetical protein
MSYLVDNIIIFSSFFFWFAIDSVPLFKNERIINSALIHSIISGVGANICCALYPAILYDYPSVHSTLPYAVSLVPLITTGYSGYDLYIGIKSKKMENILHGLTMLFGCNSAYNKGITTMLNGFILSETSSIFLNLRPFKKRWIDAMFVFTFFPYRLIISPIFTIVYVMNEENYGRIDSLIGGTLLTALNIYWFHYILKKMVKNK